MRLLYCGLVLLPFALLGLAHCGETKELAAGEECFQAVECAPGLICAPVAGKRVCTNDLKSIESPSGYDGSVPDGGVVQADVLVYDAPPVQDTFVPPPPVDAGDGGSPI